MQELYMGPLFTELVNNMNLALTAGVQDLNSTTLGVSNVKRAYAFSTADLGISGILISLNMFNYMPVPSASALILELHREANSDPFIRVWPTFLK